MLQLLPALTPSTMRQNYVANLTKQQEVLMATIKQADELAVDTQKAEVSSIYRKSKDVYGLFTPAGFLHFDIAKFVKVDGRDLLPNPASLSIDATAKVKIDPPVTIAFVPRESKSAKSMPVLVSVEANETAPSKPAKHPKADKPTKDPNDRTWSALSAKPSDNVPFMIQSHMHRWMQDRVGLKTYRLSMGELLKSIEQIGVKATCDMLDRQIDHALEQKKRYEQAETITELPVTKLEYRCPDCGSNNRVEGEFYHAGNKYDFHCLDCDAIYSSNEMFVSDMILSKTKPTEAKKEPIVTKKSEPIVTESEARLQVTDIYRTVMNITDHALTTDEQSDMIGMFRIFSHGRSIAQCLDDNDLSYDKWQSHVEDVRDFRAIDSEPPTIPMEDFNTPSPDVSAEPQTQANEQTITPDGEIIPQEVYAATAGTSDLKPSALLSQIKTLMGVPVGEIGAYMNRRHPNGAYRDTKGKDGQTWTDLDPIAVRIRFEKIFGTLGFGYRFTPVPGLSSITWSAQEKTSAKGKPYTIYSVVAVGFVMEYALVGLNGEITWNQTSVMSDACEIDDLQYVMRGVYTSLTKQALRNFGGFDHFAKNF